MGQVTVLVSCSICFNDVVLISHSIHFAWHALETLLYQIKLKIRTSCMLVCMHGHTKEAVIDGFWDDTVTDGFYDNAR